MRFLIAVIAICVSGCASNLKKEDLHEIFGQVENHQYHVADDYFKGVAPNSGRKDFDTYQEDQVIKAGPLVGIRDTVANILEVEIDTLKACDQKLAALKKLTKLDGLQKFEEEVKEIQTTCTHTGETRRIDELANVNLTNIHDAYVEAIPAIRASFGKLEEVKQVPTPMPVEVGITDKYILQRAMCAEPNFKRHMEQLVRQEQRGYNRQSVINSLNSDEIVELATWRRNIKRYNDTHADQLTPAKCKRSHEANL